MPKPKVIPPDREPEILARAGRGETAEQIAAWLSLPEVLNRNVDGRRVREFLEANRKGRVATTAAVIQEHVAKTANADLTAIDDLLKDEVALQTRIGRLDELLDVLERVARSSIKEMVDDKGRFIPLREMDDAQAAAIAGVDIEQAFSRTGPERYHSGDVIKVRLRDNTTAIVAIGRIRAQAVAQQQRLLELRLKLAGAGEGNKSAEELVAELIMQAKRAVTADPPPIPDEED